MKSYQVQLDDGRKFKVDVEDGPTSDTSSGYWSDVKKNAIEGAKEIPQGALSIADTATKSASMLSPVTIGKSLFQAAKGQPTDIAEGAKATVDMAKGAMSGTLDIAKTVGKTAIAPGEMLFGKPASQTMIGQQFRQRPLSTTANIATVAFPLFKKGAAPITESAGVEAGQNMRPEVATSVAKTTPKIPGYLETKGAQGINNIAGIRGATIDLLAGKNQNPGVVGAQLAKTLYDEGAIGKTATETFNKASGVADKYGKAVSKALEDIKSTNRATGEYSDVLDPLHIDANEALKPILDESNTMRGPGNYPEARSVGKYLKKAYDRLSDKANENNGVLTLDHVTDELKQIGSLYSKTGATDHIVDPVYHRVAALRDQMVNDIAENSGNPALAKNLRDANAGYSRYMKILPDIRRRAGMESVGQQNLGSLFKNLTGAIASDPRVSRGMMRSGETLTKPKAIEYLKKANGNKDLARKMAKAAGYSYLVNQNEK